MALCFESNKQQFPFTGDLELTTVQTMIGRKYCFTISAIDDEDVETKESVTLHLYSNDSSIHYTIFSTTVIISDNDGKDP